MKLWIMHFISLLFKDYNGRAHLYKNIVCCNVIIFIGFEIILYNRWRKYISLSDIYHYRDAIKWTLRYNWAFVGIGSKDEGLVNMVKFIVISENYFINLFLEPHKNNFKSFLFDIYCEIINST